MNLIKAYYYLNYKFFIFFESFEQTRWLAQSKALICVGILELGLYLSFVNYRDVLLHVNSTLGRYTIVFLLIITVLKVLILVKDKQWKKYLTLFNSLAKEKNLMGTWIMISLTILIIINFIVSCILFSPLRGLSNGSF